MFYGTFLLQIYKKIILRNKNMLKFDVFIVYNSSEKNINFCKKEVFI